jgi:hypothetical protein
MRGGPPHVAGQARIWAFDLYKISSPGLTIGFSIYFTGYVSLIRLAGGGIMDEVDEVF